MKNYGSQVAGIILTFVVTMLLNFTVSEMLLEDGTIAVNTYKNTSGEYITQIRIENYTQHIISGLKILIPSKIEIAKIASTSTVNLQPEEKSNLSNKTQQILDVSLIPPRTITTLFISQNDDSACCSVLNAKELKLKWEAGYEADNPTSRAFYDSLRMSLISIIFVAALWLWAHSKYLQTEAKLDEIKKNIEASHKHADEIKNLHHEMKRLDARRKALLIRRLSDYSKELTFWRDTIRKMLYEKSASPLDVKQIFAAITECLGTFRTLEQSQVGYEIVEALAEDLIAHEGGHKKI